MRGSTRANIKVLSDQDKVVVSLKHKNKQLEKESAQLRNENRSLQDVDVRLKDAQAEIKRLLSLVDEVNSLKVGVRNAEDEKKVMEGQYKKMRKFMRQSIISGGGSKIMQQKPGGGSIPSPTANSFSTDSILNSNDIISPSFDGDDEDDDYDERGDNFLSEE
jgi:hypothetical protein